MPERAPDTEEFSMTIIASAGDCMSKLHDALSQAKRGDFPLCARLLQEADARLKAAHEAHTQLMVDAVDTPLNWSPLLGHAQDSLMSALLAQTLFRELAALYQRLAGGEDESESASAS